KKHRKNIKKLIDKDIGLWNLEENDFKIVQKGRLSNSFNKKLLCNLLRKNEILSLLKANNKATSDTSRDSLNNLASTLSKQTIKAQILHSLKKRYFSASQKIISSMVNGDRNPEILLRERSGLLLAKASYTLEINYPDDLKLAELSRECESSLFGPIPEFA
ncbi:hypothetical protein, partial [Curvivirga aplysinae]|uniref:hypothetical protein n=1 Tax=Curvivirga aplysinae TaxID=2529852 RepID=UPI001C3F550C